MMQPVRWHVITGAPCSGKTSVIVELEAKGFQVVHEVARAYIDDELQKGRRIDEIKIDELAFERAILDQKVAIESSLVVDCTVFLDRAVPDSIAYYRLAGLDPKEAVQKSRVFRYQKVFLLERFEFEKDGVRSEDDARAEKLELLLTNGYRELEYEIMRVPRLSIRERVDFILENLE